MLLIAYSLVILFAMILVVGSLAHSFNSSSLQFILIGLIFIIAIWLLVMFCTEGDNFTNKYGPDPKADDEEINQIGINE